MSDDEVFGPYRLRGLIGRVGMGEVVHALDVGDAPMKAVTPDGTKTVVAIKGSNSVTVLDVGRVADH